MTPDNDGLQRAQDIDREIRMAKMEQEIEDLADGKIIRGGAEHVPRDVEEDFLRHVLAFEKAHLETPIVRLKERGITLLPPEELDDNTLEKELEKVISSLASMRCFLYHTDHLSNRALYTWLWREGLREEVPDPEALSGAWRTSPIGAGTDEDTQIFLRYYATPEEREGWRQQFPDDILPEPESPPYDRDRHLPRPRA